MQLEESITFGKKMLVQALTDFGIDLKKSIYTDLSSAHQQGLRASLKEYVLQGLATINGRRKLENVISKNNFQ